MLHGVSILFIVLRGLKLLEALVRPCMVLTPLLGVINIITKGADSINKNSVGGSVGSFNSKSMWFNGAHTGQGYEIGLSAEYSKSDGYNELIDIDAQNVFDIIAAEEFNLPAVSLAPGSVNTSFEVLDVFCESKSG